MFSVTSGCTLYQRPEVPPVKIPKNFKTCVVSCPNLKDHWWENFDDCQLNKLVCIALKNNLNYQVAIKNIQIAQTYVDQSASALLPEINLNYNATRNKLSNNAFNFLNVPNVGTTTHSRVPPFDLYQLYLAATYEFDVWNQIGNSVNQAKANVIVSEEQSNVVKLTLITNVVNTYFQITTLNATLANLSEQYCCTSKIVKLLKNQYKAGLIDIASVDDAKNQMETIKANMASLEKQREILINSMAYLLGIYPENFCCPIDNPFKIPCFTMLIPPSIPCSMLANRPDVQSAFYQIVSYGYLEKQNIANFLPSFNLIGGMAPPANGGFSSNHMGNLLTRGSIFWNYGINILQPLFDYGYRMSLYTQSKLQFESAVLSYRDTVMNAFSEVDDALTSYKEDADAFYAFERQNINTKNKLKLANAQFQAGLTDYSTYLTIKLNYLQTDYNLMNQKLLVAQDIIQVYKALGMGLCVC